MLYTETLAPAVKLCLQFFVSQFIIWIPFIYYPDNIGDCHSLLNFHALDFLDVLPPVGPTIAQIENLGGYVPAGNLHI
jgi:hypothetical protein